jgi:carbon-monoxide dehydrogenase medium subunit
MDLAIVGVAAIIMLQSPDDVCQDVKVVLGAVAPTPMRARGAEDLIRGKTIKHDLINKASQLAAEEARPISDVRSSAEYRREMVKVFTEKALREAFQLAKGGSG